MVSAKAKRSVGHYLQEIYPFSQRRVCELLKMSRSSFSYQSKRDKTTNQHLNERLKTLAQERPRFGYRRLHALLRREGFEVNHKRVYRLYREEDLTLPRRQRKRLVTVSRVPLALPSSSNERWSMDFIHDQLASGTRFRILNVLDDFTRECLATEVDLSLPGERVVRVLQRLIETRGKPQSIVLDNGPEFVSRVLDQWAYRHGIHLAFIPPAKPSANAFVESFHSRFRDECLNRHWFTSLVDARTLIEAWRQDYNEQRPHSSLAYLTPHEFAALDSKSPQALYSP